LVVLTGLAGEAHAKQRTELQPKLPGPLIAQKEPDNLQGPENNSIFCLRAATRFGNNIHF
jgi:hypothetical protein